MVKSNINTYSSLCSLNTALEKNYDPVEKISKIQESFTDAIKNGGISLWAGQKLLLYIAELTKSSSAEVLYLFGWKMHQISLKAPRCSQKMLADWEILGISMASNYAVRLLPDSNLENLKDLLRELQLNLKDKIYFDDSLKFYGFDWLMATIFIIMESDIEKVAQYLVPFSQTIGSLYLWPSFGRSVENGIRKDSLISYLSANGYHWIEAIVEIYHPMVFSAFTLNGCSVTQVNVAINISFAKNGFVSAFGTF